MQNLENTIDRIQELIDSDTEQQLKDELVTYHSADIADIFQQLTPEERLACFSKLDDEKAAEVIEYLPPQLQVEIFQINLKTTSRRSGRRFGRHGRR